MKFIKFNKNWKFWEITNSFSLDWGVPSDAREVDLPHDAMIEVPQDPDCLSGGNTGYRKGGIYSYSKSFFAGDPGKTYFLKIDGAYMNAFVYVNGQLAAKRPNGYTVFYVPLNKYLNYGAENEIRIQVRAGAEPNSRWYSGTGLYRDVYLLESGPLYIKPDSVEIRTVRIPEPAESKELSTPVQDPAADTAKGIFTVKTDSLSCDRTDKTAAQLHIFAMTASGFDGDIPGTLEIIISDASGKTVASLLVPIEKYRVSDESATALAYAIPMQGFENSLPPQTEYYPVDADITIPHPYLWDADNPNLYTCTLNLKSSSGAILDTHSETFGIRSISVSPSEGLQVNGKTVKLRGACIHHDSGILGAKTYEEVHIRQIRKLKEAGFNAIRSAHNPAAPALLSACDKVGMYVMDEAFDIWTRHKSDYDYGMFFAEWWEADVEAMVRNAYNHPSVLMYSIGNEIPEIGTPQGERITQMICEVIKAQDISRPILASVNGIFSVGDKLGQIISDVAADLKSQGKADGNVNDFMGFMHQYMNDLTRHSIVDSTISVPFRHTDVAGYNYMGSRYEMDGALHPERVIVGSETGISEICDNWNQVKKLPYVIGDFCWTGWEYLGEAGIGAPNYSEDSNPFGNAQFPMQISGTGCIDITGRRLPMSYYREIVFGLRKDPYIAVRDPAHHGEELVKNPWIMTDAIGCWGFDDFTGQPVTVEVYFDAEEVELLKNGISLGRKKADECDRFTALFETTYEPGTLTAISYTNGMETGRYEISSPGDRLQLAVTEEPPYSTQIPVIEHPEEKEDIFAGINQYFAAKDPMNQININSPSTANQMMAEYQAASIKAKELTEQLKASYLNGKANKPELILDIRESSLLKPDTTPDPAAASTSEAPVASMPGAPVDSMPGAHVDSMSGSHVASMPGAPAAVQQNVSATATPGAATVSQYGEPIASIHEAPAASMSGAPAAAQQDVSAAVTSMPQASAASFPDEPEDTSRIRFLNVEITDEKGTVAYGHDMELTLSIDGEARLLGFGSADPKPVYNYTDSKVKTWQGRAQLILLTDPSAAPATLSITSDTGLTCSIELQNI